MLVSEAASKRYIGGLAQTIPFRFVDRVRFLDDSRVVTDLCSRALPHRFVAPGQVDTYVILEFAAQSCGLILRGRKKSQGGRGFIASLTGERRNRGGIELPLQLDAHLVEERWARFEFRFQVHSGTELVFVGSVGIFIGR
jgi:hypothetical protein